MCSVPLGNVKLSLRVDAERDAVRQDAPALSRNTLSLALCYSLSLSLTSLSWQVAQLLQVQCLHAVAAV